MNYKTCDYCKNKPKTIQEFVNESCQECMKQSHNRFIPATEEIKQIMDDEKREFFEKLFGGE